MTFGLWLAPIVAVGTLIAIPGPTNLMVIACGLRHGTKPALSTVFGIVPGVIAAMILSFLGLGAILATSALLFMVMKWAGALYLIYLGIGQWRSSPEVEEIEVDQPQVSGLAILVQAFTVTFLNPKGFVFYIAFMPQFIVTQAPVLPQMLILGAIFVVLIFPINTAYALLAGRLRTVIQNRRLLRTMNRTGGAMLIGAGILTASLKRS